MSKWARVSIATLAAGMAVSVPAGVLSLSAGQAGASTTACGSSCTTPANQLAGAGEALTISIVPEASGASCPTTITASALENVTTPCVISIKMATASSINAGQDWTGMIEGGNTSGVTTFLNAQALPPKLGIQYSGQDVVEFEAVPNGVPTGLCLSASNSGSSFGAGGLGLTACGQVATTVTSGVQTISNPTAWILDQGNNTNGFEDLISGTSQAYSLPQVLTVSASGTNVSLAQLSEFNGIVSSGQMWSFSYGAQSAATLKRVGMLHT